MIFFHFDIRERMNVSFHVGKIIVDMYIYIRIRFFIIPVSFSLFSISFVQISYNSSSNSSIVASKDLSIFILEI